MPSKKKKYNARFPAGRIKKIMQTDEEVGKVAQAVPVIISRTLELFVESLLAKSLDVTVKRSAKTLTPSHVKHCILSESRFDFLKDLVANIPDISNVEEPQNLSADNSPTTNRFSDNSSNPGPSTVCRRPRQAHNKKDNGQSSDSGSDHEPVAKRLAKNPLGNGKHPKPMPNFDDDLKVFMQRKKSLTQTPEPSPSFAVPNPATPSGDNKQRLFNFYTETLPDTSEEEEKNTNKPAYSSVIQPNPEYNKSFGFYKPVGTSQESVENPFQFPKSIVPAPSSIKAAEIVPKIHIDLTNGYPIQTSVTLNASGQPTPSYHLDFSAMPIPSPLGGRKAPPPLQTIKRSTSLPEPSSSSTERILKSSGANKSRIDRTSLSFDSPGSSSGSGSRNKPEPPLLLPLNLVPKSKCPPVLEIDEDYDT